MDDLSTVPWRTSSYSGGNGGGCVEVGTSADGRVLVRDSKNRTGAVLGVTEKAWLALVTRVKSTKAPG
jgi:hypothetical protein